MCLDKPNKMNKVETKTIIRSLLSSRSSSCGIYTLNKEFKDETGIDIPLFGYTSLSEFLESIPDAIKLTGMYPIQKVSLVKNDTSSHIVSLVKRQRRNKKSKKGLGGNTGGNIFRNNRPKNYICSTVIDKKPETNQNKSQNLHQKQIPLQREDLKPQNRKFNAVKDEKSNAKQNEISGFVKKKGTPKKFKPKNWRLSGDKTGNCKQIKLSRCSQEKALVGGIDSASLLRISDCFVRSDEKIAGNNLKLHARVGDYVEVYPCEISHPNLFYLVLRSLKKTLSAFMDKLQQFYNVHEEIPKLNEVPKLDQICVVCYSRHGESPQWHRVQVEEILSSCLVVVRFIDYGMTAKILVKNLKLLHRDFVSFPRQAVSGSLANIKPSDGRFEWTKAAIKRFHELAFCRDLVGGVVSIDCDACSLSLALSSTVGEEVHINDTLVEEGFAEFDLSAVKDFEESETGREKSRKASATSSSRADFVPSPVFFSEKKQPNRRLQQMFSERKE